MTHEEQIKWMTDRIAHLETQYERAMEMVETLMGKLKPLTEKAVEAEREACADIAENWNSNGFPRTGVAEQIRARGKA